MTGTYVGKLFLFTVKFAFKVSVTVLENVFCFSHRASQLVLHS